MGIIEGSKLFVFMHGQQNIASSDSYYRKDVHK